MDKHAISRVTITKRKKNHLFFLFPLPFHLVCQTLPAPQPFQEFPVFLACLALQRALEVPQVLALQRLYPGAQVLRRDLAPLGRPLFLSLLGNLEDPDEQHERDL